MSSQAFNILLAIFAIIWPLLVARYWLTVPADGASTGFEAKRVGFVVWLAGFAAASFLMALYRIQYPGAWTEDQPTVYWLFGILLYVVALVALVGARSHTPARDRR